MVVPYTERSTPWLFEDMLHVLQRFGNKREMGDLICLELQVKELQKRWERGDWFIQGYADELRKIEEMVRNVLIVEVQT